ncbi:MAG: hypothetical protein DCF25_16535 [Leptolyngbya foveolarum]|uniref:Uncharacterized protein n=1 Tax=Leptolyngbya foveolarum TaxID=47253 RepID=A0A2W4VTU8_9CYAN|nr:MAG: hypothetical protein DCF25_16535 [Leptolyngbya foveolarum]
MLLSDYPRNIVHLSATVDSDGTTPLIFWFFNGRVGKLTLGEAQDRAETLFAAAIFSEIEAELSAKSSVQSELLEALSNLKQPLPSAISTVLDGQSAVVQVDCYGEQICFNPDQARSHAIALLGYVSGLGRRVA